ncbi:MAG: aspartate/tyrosine/aromatic aminotransferase [Mariniblastus sp.]|nr:aspartate/tyrosine/aromatic aminotransferase [Mariniblastus sp.]
MFETVTLCPPDAVFGLTEEFKRDPNPDKVNLTVGVYCDEQGRVPIMRSVQQVEQRMLDEQQGHSYLPIDGLPGYDRLVAELILGPDHPVIQQQRFATVQTPGGTGALRIAGEFLKRQCDVSRIWISNPTWSNHLQIFRAAGLELQTYDYLDERGTGLDFASVCRGVDAAQPGDAVLVHTVCHNPTGVDLDAEQWVELLQRISDKRLYPIFDFAYQGFGAGLEADAEPIRRFVNGAPFQGEALICNSFSKNFNLYGERVGGLTVTASTSETVQAMLSQLKSIVRTTYSNPPRHGGAIVEQVLADDSLRADWERELDGIRERIQSLRDAFVDRMAEVLPGTDFDHIRRQRGMFSYSGISADHVERLKREYGVYLLGSGRINIAGLNRENLDYVCTSIAAVLGDGG